MSVDNIINYTIKFNNLNTSITGLDNLTNKIQGVSKAAKIAGEVTQSSFGKMAKSLSNSIVSINNTLKATQSLISVISKPFAIAGQFESMQMSMEVLLGSADKAEQRIKELSRFTKGTTFELPEVVQASTELQSLGKYSQGTLTMLGNLAIGSGKSLEQVTNAYVSLVRGNKGIATELFRDIGITTDDFVKATGSGINLATGMITASSQEMIDSLGQIMQDKNFEGLMERQNQTLGGQLSNLKDSLDQFMAEFGVSLMPIATGLIQSIIPILDFLKNNINIVSVGVVGLTGVFLTWKAYAVILAGVINVSLLPAIQKQILLMNTGVIPSINAGLIPSLKTVASAILNVAIPAIKALGIAIITSPIGVFIGLTSLLAGAFLTYKAIFHESTEAKLEDKNAELEVLEARKESIETVKSQKEEIKNLCDEYEQLAEKTNRTKEEESKLKDIAEKLNAEYPGLIKESKDFENSLGNVQRKAKETSYELGNCTAKLRDIELQSIETRKAISELDVAITEEELYETFAKETSNWFEYALGSASKFLFGTSTALKNGEKFFEDYTNSVKNAADEQAMKVAYDDVVEKIMSMTDVDMQAKKKMIMQAKAMRDAQVEHLKQMKDLKEQEKKIMSGESDAVGIVTEKPFRIAEQQLAVSYDKLVAVAKEKAKKLGKAVNLSDTNIKIDNKGFADIRKDIEDLLLNTDEKLSEQEIRKIRIKFGLDTDQQKVNTAKVTKETQVDIANIYKNLYDTHVVNATQYQQKLDELINEINTNEKFKQLTADFETGKLTEKDNKGKYKYADDLNEYNKLISQRKALETERNSTEEKAFKESIDKQENQFKIRKDLYDKDYIGTETYLKNLEGLMDDTINVIAKDSTDLQNVLGGIKLGTLVGEGLENAIQKLAKDNPELKKKFSEIIAIVKNYKNEMEVVIKKNLEEKIANMNNAITGIGKDINFKVAYKAIDDVMDYAKGQKNAIDKKHNEAFNQQDFEGDEDKRKEAVQQMHTNIKQEQKQYEEIIKQGTEAKENLYKQDITKMEYWVQRITTLAENVALGIGQALAKGFGAEGFKTLTDAIKEGFKMVLVAIIDSLSNMLYAGTIMTLIESIFNQAKAVVDGGKLLAGKLGLEVLKGLVMSMATGGMVTRPTLLMAGDAGPELYAPKRDFLTIAREMMIEERRNMPALNQQSQKVVVEVKMQPVVLKQKGRDMYGVIQQQEELDAARRF